MAWGRGEGEDERRTGRVGRSTGPPRDAADWVGQLLLAGPGGCRRGARVVQEELRSVDGAEGGEGMSSFTEKEIEYLEEQRLGRLATVDVEGRPHVVPVAFRYNAEHDTLDIGGRNIGASKKFRDAQKTGRAAFVVDDVLPPWRARGSRSGAGARSFRRVERRSWRTSRRS